MGILELLAKNEENIARLYTLYAEIMPEYRELWAGLASDEMGHASWIRDFAKGVGDGSISLNEKRFPREAFQTYTEYLDGSMARARRMGVETIQAFTTALYIEESLIELRFFEVIDTGSKDFDKVALHLKNATKGHIEKIKKYWAEVKDKR